MGKDSRNRFSHRFKALDKLKQWLAEQHTWFGSALGHDPVGPNPYR